MKTESQRIEIYDGVEGVCPKDFSQHALDRYMERTGTKSVTRALGKLYVKCANALLIRRTKNQRLFYHKGWVLAASKTKVETIYRPRRKTELNAIYKTLHHKL